MYLRRAAALSLDPLRQPHPESAASTGKIPGLAAIPEHPAAAAAARWAPPRGGPCRRLVQTSGW